MRGDSNQDGVADISDAIHALDYLFVGGVDVLCLDAADMNDDGGLDISDPVFLLTSLFLGGPDVPPPYPGRGLDLTLDELSCESYAP